jgi:hypothetical protein
VVTLSISSAFPTFTTESVKNSLHKDERLLRAKGQGARAQAAKVWRCVAPPPSPASLLTSVSLAASPSSIALAMAFGVSGGIFPIPGVTTVPVMAAIFLFRLNPVAAMLTNYLVTPLNIASVPVFM